MNEESIEVKENPRELVYTDDFINIERVVVPGGWLYFTSRMVANRVVTHESFVPTPPVVAAKTQPKNALVQLPGKQES